jgi:DNA-binding Lrp family transcriptional regulator
MRIYLYILTRGGNVSVRDIARDLNLPPSTVHYNLKRLEEAGCIVKSSSGYAVRNPVRVEGYVILGKLLIPRLLIYGLFFTGIFTGTLIYSLSTGFTGERLLLLAVLITASVLFYIEALNARRKILV